MAKICERCGGLPVTQNDRYCKECRKAVLMELAETGYLSSKVFGHCGQSRTNEQRENTYETKHGTGH
jgi:hypothetical protein